MHRFPRGHVRDLGSNMISSFDVAVDLEITTITKKIAGPRRRRRALRAVEDRALLLAKIARLFEGNNSLIDEDFRRRFLIGDFGGLLQVPFNLIVRVLLAGSYMGQFPEDGGNGHFVSFFF